MPLIRRNQKDSRKAIAEWWNKPEHAKPRRGDMIAVTSDDNVDDPQHNEPTPHGIDPEWYETPYGWVSMKEES